MGTAKRERQKQGRQARIDAARVAQQKATRVRTVRNFAIVIVLIVVGIFAVAKLTGGKDNSDNSVVASNSGSSSPSSSSSPTITVPAAGATLTGDTPCPNADGSSQRTTKFAKAPPMCIDATKTYTATVVTTKGTFTIALDAKAAPATVNNFVVLAQYHYYDGVAFHRIITGFMDQTGDANGPTPGVGNPGYTIPDELPAAASAYTDGAVAMANTGQPNSGADEWFVVVDNGGQQLAASYTKFGQVTTGLDVAKAINAVGSAGSQGTPTELVTITKVTITTS